MNRWRSKVERRLLDAAVLVLASSGCQSVPPAVPDRGPVGTTPTGSASSSAGTSGSDGPTFATPPDAASPPDASSAVIAPPDATSPVVATTPPPSRAQSDPSGFCADYKQRAVLAKRHRKPPRTPVRALGGGNMPIDEHEMRGGASWIAARNEVACTIVHDQRPGPVTLTHSPTCCPTGRGNTPCPPSYDITVNGQLSLIENVRLRPDGSVASRSVAWSGTGTDPNPRHNCGRRPEGMRLVGRSDDPAELGATIAEMAELEAASISAFERLARELAHHGAPATLVRRALLAMGDEVRHARVMTELAKSYGWTPRAIEVPRLPCRTLHEIAHENAIEGCVREAYGALVATYQAERAAPELRARFAAIAADERSHAALSEDVHTWIARKLDEGSRAELRATRARAEHELHATLDTMPGCVTLGLPTRADARALFCAYFG